MLLRLSVSASVLLRLSVSASLVCLFDLYHLTLMTHGFPHLMASLVSSHVTSILFLHCLCPFFVFHDHTPKPGSDEVGSPEPLQGLLSGSLCQLVSMGTEVLIQDLIAIVISY